VTKVLMLLKTTGLEYDDRIRKECLSLMSLGAEPVVAVLADKNHSSRETTDYGVCYQSVSLFSRKLFPQAHGLILKTAEIYLRFVCILICEKPDVLWIHDMTMGGMVPFAHLLRKSGRLARLVWDQHELPPDGVLANNFKKRLFGKVISLCDVVVAANHDRCELLQTEFGELRLPPFYVLENFPDTRFAELPEGQLPSDIVSWLDRKPYVLTQGGGDDERRLAECVEAVVRIGTVKLVVVGRFRRDARAKLKARWGAQLEEFVYFTGMVPQKEMVNYIDHAVASIVIYARTNRNSWLCAPNRLYQAISRGVPVIVGCNPPLMRFIGKTGAGIALQSDGADVQDLTNGIEQMLGHHSTFKQNAQRNRNAYVWDSQVDAIRKIVGSADPPQPVLEGKVRACQEEAPGET